MDQQAGEVNVEIQRNEDNSGNSIVNRREENMLTDQDNMQEIRFTVLHPSDSDVLMNKSDSEEGLFITDSSDDVMNDVLSDFSPAKDCMEQTRKTIMESLIKSFPPVAPVNLNSACDPNESANEHKSTNDGNDFDSIDMSVKNDKQSLESIIPMRRLTSDSAFPDFRRNAGDVASVAASDEYVTIGSASEEPTTASFFSQSASTSQLHAAVRPGTCGRSKSASSFRRYRTPDKDEAHSISGKPACDDTFDHWPLSDAWLMKNSTDLLQTRQKVSPDPGKVKTPSEDKLKKQQSYANDSHPSPESGGLETDFQTNQESKPQAKICSDKSTFKATKLPRLYRQRSRAKIGSSRSESCVAPKETPIANENVTIRTNRSSNAKHSRWPVNSTTNERHDRKDAGGVSYAAKHCVSPERTKQNRAAYKVMSPVATRFPEREKQAFSHEPIKTPASGSTRNTEDGDHHKRKDQIRACIDASRIRSSTMRRDRNKVTYALKNDESQSGSQSVNTAGHPTRDGYKLPQRGRLDSPMKVAKILSSSGLTSVKSPTEHCIVRQKSDGASPKPSPKSAASPKSKMSLKRPTPSPRGSTSPLAGSPAALSGTEHAAHSVSSGPIEHSSVGTGDERSAETGPPLMSLKVDVSVRASDGSVHSFRDISPPRDGMTGDLFAGVEEFIRNLLEAPAAAPPLTSAISPRNVPLQSAGKSADESAADRGMVTDINPAAAPTATPCTSRQTRGELFDRRHRRALDVYSQKLQTEESVLLLTSSGSVSSIDLWPQAARQIVYPLTTIPVLSVSTKRSKPRLSPVAVCPAANQPGCGESNGRDEERLSSDWQKQCPRQPEADTVPTHSAVSEPCGCHNDVDVDVSPERSAQLAPPSSPVGMKSVPSSPERGRTPSPWSRIPILKRMVSESAVRASHSPSPERHSFYQTAQTTPERPRSATPDSLRSATGSSGSLRCLKRSPHAVELNYFGTASPFRASPSASEKMRNFRRSPSLSPRSTRSSPRRNSPLGDPHCTSQHNQAPKRVSPVGMINRKLTCAGKTASGDAVWTKRLPVSVTLSPSGVGPVAVETKSVKDSTTDIEHFTSSLGMHTEDTSPGGCAQIRRKYATAAHSSTPTPTKRSTYGTFISQQDTPIQKPIPQKRRRDMSPVRPGVLCPWNEEAMISTKTSFCSMDSPVRNMSPSPPEAKIAKPTIGTGGDPLDHEHPYDIEKSAFKDFQKEERTEDKIKQANEEIPGPMKIKSEVSDNSSSSSLSHSDSPRSARSNSSRQHSSDPTEVTEEPEQSEPRQQQGLNADGGVGTTSLEKEMIETENTVKLMEETISVLERQNISLATNTKVISEKIYQERSRKCDLKTAKLMLQKVRMELQKTTKNIEDNRVQLLNANKKISEQESAILLLKDSLREECIKNVRMERCLRQKILASEGNSASQHLPQSSEVDRRDNTASSLLAEPISVRQLLEETETLLQEERKARKDVEEKLAQERSRKLRISNAAKWRQKFNVDSKLFGLNINSMDQDCKDGMFPEVNESDSSNIKSYQTIHISRNSNKSINIDSTACKSDESILSKQNCDLESASGSEYFLKKLTRKQEVACQCELLDSSSNWKEKYVEIKRINDLCLTKMNDVQNDRMKMRSELQLVNFKLKEETQRKDQFEEELKNLIDKIHDMQRDVQVYQRQSKEQLVTLRQGDRERIENMELEKLKLKDYYQQQLEAIVEEKVSEFQGKVSHLEAVVRKQINTYTKSMQQKFREKLSTASIQQKEVISRLEVEHSQEVERLIAEYPQEVERLQQRLAECRKEVIDNKNRLEQRETQVGTILRVVKLLIREGNAVKGDTAKQNTVEIARKILRCMDLNLDDIVSPRPCLTDCKEQRSDREYVTKDGSTVTFRSIPESPRAVPASRDTQRKSAPPVMSKIKASSNDCDQNATLTQNSSVDSTESQPFNVSGLVKKKTSYTRFGDEVIRAKSEESLQNTITTQTKQLSTTSDLSRWVDSGSWMLDESRPVAPPPTPPSFLTSTGTNTDEPELVPKGSADYVTSSVMKKVNHPVRMKTVADKGTGSATSLIRDPSFFILTNSILAEDPTQMCQCNRLQLAVAYDRLRMTGTHGKRLKEGLPGRERTRSSSETSLNRLANTCFETIKDTGVLETTMLRSNKLNVSSLTRSEQQSGNTEENGSKSASKTSSDSNKLLSNDIHKMLAVKTIKSGNKVEDPFSMKPMPSRPLNRASENISSKPPIQNMSASPSRSITVLSSSPTHGKKIIVGDTVTTAVQPDVKKPLSRQDATRFAERTRCPSQNVPSRAKKTSTTLNRMPSFDRAEMIDCNESPEDSKFAWSRSPPTLEQKPRDNKGSVQRKQLAAIRRHSPSEKEIHHSMSPRERKLFTLRNQQHAEKKVTRTEMTRRTLSPVPGSAQVFLPTAAAQGQTRNSVPTLKNQRDRGRSGRRSASSSMDWKRYIKSGQPWQDIYLHEHNEPNYVEPIPTNGTYYTAETHNEESERSDWSPSYSWAPPRPGERDKWNRYLTTGQAAEQIALERFYATPERESADARRRMRRSRKQAEVLEHINRLMAVSSGSDPSEETDGRRVERGAGRRARSQPRQESEPVWPAHVEHEHGHSAVLDGVRKKALGQLGVRHPADPLADLPARRAPSGHGGPHQQRLSLSLDRGLPVSRRDCNVHERLSSDVKTRHRLAKEYAKQRRHGGAQERSVSQQRWTPDSRGKVPLVLVSRTPRGALVPPERRHRRRSHSHSRHGTATLDDLDMDSWVDQWERKWNHERKQKPQTHWPLT